MTVVYFVRHAHSPWLPNREATRPLSAGGHEAAANLAVTLADCPIDTVYSSPYARAVQTVEPIAANHDLPVEVVADFRERQLTDGPVEATGETFERAIDAVWGDWDFAWPGGESNHEAQERGVSALEALLDAHAGAHVVVGTHGNLLTLMLNHYDDRFDVEFWRDSLSMPDCYRVEVSGGELHSSERLPSRQT